MHVYVLPAWLLFCINWRSEVVRTIKLSSLIFFLIDGREKRSSYVLCRAVYSLCLRSRRVDVIHVLHTVSHVTCIIFSCGFFSIFTWLHLRFKSVWIVCDRAWRIMLIGKQQPSFSAPRALSVPFVRGIKLNEHNSPDPSVWFQNSHNSSSANFQTCVFGLCDTIEVLWHGRILRSNSVQCEE